MSNLWRRVFSSALYLATLIRFAACSFRNGWKFSAIWIPIVPEFITRVLPKVKKIDGITEVTVSNFRIPIQSEIYFLMIKEVNFVSISFSQLN